MTKKNRKMLEGLVLAIAFYFITFVVLKILSRETP